MIEQRSKEWFDMRLGMITSGGFKHLMDGYVEISPSQIDELQELELRKNGRLMGKANKPLSYTESFKQRHEQLLHLKANPSLGKGALSWLKSKIVENITGYNVEIYSPHLQWGLDYEEMAFERAKEMLNIDFEATTFFEYKGKIEEFIGYVGGTPDGISDEYVLELKCPSNPTRQFDRLLDTEDFIAEYKWQVLGEMFVTGKEKAYLCSFDPRYPDHLNLVSVEFTKEKYIEDFILMQERLKQGVAAYKKMIQEFKEATKNRIL